MTEHELYEQLLNLPEIRVSGVVVEPKRITFHCHGRTEGGVCPNCLEKTSALNQYYTRKVRDLDISGREVWLEIRERQWVCPTCNRYFMEPFDFVEGGKSYTRRQAKWVFEMCARQPFTEVGALANMCHKTVERLYYEEAERRIDLPARYAKVRKLGIDEIAHRKGKRDFCCVLTDLERGIQLDILPDRRKATLVAHFKALGDGFCQQIQMVSCDIWEPYILAARECFPLAQVVIDRFHVVKALNTALDSLRKTLRKEMPKEECFKALKWSLFKQPRNCAGEELEQLNRAFALSPLLEEMYEARNAFHHILELGRGKLWAAKQLEHWMEFVELSANKHFDTFLKTLRNWKDYIAAYANEFLSNAVTEGLNNFIRYFKRLSFGISNFEHLKLRVLVNSC